MFLYVDPTGTGLLERVGALRSYRQIVHARYRTFARLRRSSFTLLEAFDGTPAETAEVEWIAFPRTAQATDQEVDGHRFVGGPNGEGLQDEYVEWRVERAGGRVTRVTFTTEFPEYFEACAGVGFDAVREAIREVIPTADPTVAEVFGPTFDPRGASEEARQAQFVGQLPNNPWQDGRQSILCLQQGANTLGALFNLVGECAVMLQGASSAACASAKFGACGPGRNSDPNVCTAVQELRRDNRVVSLADPAGVVMKGLGGNWRLAGRQIDMSDAATGGQIWRIGRNGRRAVLEVPESLTLTNNAITSGAQVAKVLRVGAKVIHAKESDAPEWARTGQESSRQIV